MGRFVSSRGHSPVTPRGFGMASSAIRHFRGPSNVTPMPGTAAARASNMRSHWLEAFRDVRGETERRAAPLSAEDQVIQSMPDASPTKWHRAHTTWFFEQFLLLPHLARLPRLRRAVRLSVQLLLRRRRSAARAAAARAGDAAGERARSPPIAPMSTTAVVRLHRLKPTRRSSPRCCASSRSGSITSSSIRSCCSPTSCTPSR